MFPFAKSTQALSTEPATRAVSCVDSIQATLSLRILSLAVWFTLVSSVFEGPLRYALSMVGLNSLIFFRDGLLVLSLIGVVVFRPKAAAIPAGVGLVGALLFIHSFVSYMNLHSLSAIGYGIKMLLPAMCAFLVPASLFKLKSRTYVFVVVIWLVSAVGATLDKFWIDYPWVGMNVEFDGVEVFLGRDWNSALERVAGLTRSSINLAIVMPLLSTMLLTQMKNKVLITLMCVSTLCILYWSTQKGAILGFALALALFAVARPPSARPLRIAVMLAIGLMVFAPSVLIFFDMPRDSGTFSFESFIERINSMWPGAWNWIGRFSPVMGVGMGGIGGAQRFYAPEYQNAADNLFLYLFANFGIVSFVYLAAVIWLVANIRMSAKADDGIALLSLIFLLMYGVVVTLIEDQVGSLWLGASLGWLVNRLAPERQRLASRTDRQRTRHFLPKQMNR